MNEADAMQIYDLNDIAAEILVDMNEAKANIREIVKIINK